MLKTRFGRWMLLLGLLAIAGLWFDPNVLPGGMGGPQTSPKWNHRPPVSAHAGEIVTLRVTWSGNHKPSAIGWAIGNAQNPVNMGAVPDIPTKFEQHMPYDPRVRYEIWAHGWHPTSCDVLIDGSVIDHDQLPADAPTIQETHCWIDPL